MKLNRMIIFLLFPSVTKIDTEQNESLDIILSSEKVKALRAQRKNASENVVC